MEKSTQSITEIPKMEFNFVLDVQGEDSKKFFQGNFTYKRPTIGNKIDIAKMHCKLSEDLITLSEDVKMLNEMLSFLRYTLVSYPEWWKESGYGLNLYDLKPITELYKACQEFEKKWEESVNKSVT